MHRFLKFIFFSIYILISITIFAQPSAETTYNSNNSFIDYQKSFKRPMESIMKKEKIDGWYSPGRNYLHFDEKLSFEKASKIVKDNADKIIGWN